jgi:hypothetical protein
VRADSSVRSVADNSIRIGVVFIPRYSPYIGIEGQVPGWILSSRAVYLAEDVETAHREGLQVMVGTPLRPPAGVTRAIHTVEVAIKEVIGLRDPAVRALLGTSAAELAGPWRYRKDRRQPPTQRFGGAVAKCGIAGLLFQSTKGAGACLAVFIDNLKHSGSFVEVRDGSGVLERLP